MRRLLLQGLTGLLLTAVATGPWAAGPDLPTVKAWAQAARVPGYTYGGTEETDPGVYMAGWMNARQEAVAIHVSPGSAFKSFQQVINKKKPVSFTYAGQPAVYSDALGPIGNVAVHYTAANKVISITHANHPRALTQDELVKLLDAMQPARLFGL